MKRALLSMAVVLTLLLSTSAPALASRPTMANGDFAGLDGAGNAWQVQFNVKGSMLGRGEVSFTSWQSLPDGTFVEAAFTVDVERYFGVQSWSTVIDAGAAAGMCGPVVASTGEVGVPPVGSFCYFHVWDGGRGPIEPGVEPVVFHDRWKYWFGTGSPTELRNFAREVISTYAIQGSNLWPVIDGNIQVRGGVESE